jgi:exopolysaccharide biosynthesis polyprenyl glycosylphosphotransferase
MVRLFNVHLPRRTLLLAVSEAGLVVTLLLATVATGREGAWVWLCYENGFLRIGIVAVIFLLCMYYYDLYDSLVLKSLREALTRLPEVLGTACLALAALYLVAPAFRLRLATLLLGMTLVGLGVAVVRNLYLAITHVPALAERYILVGEGRLAEALASEIEKRPELGIRLVCRVPDAAVDLESNAWAMREDLSAPPNQARPSGVILASDRCRRIPPTLRNSQTFEILDGVEFYEIITGKVWLDALEDDNLARPGMVAASPFLLVGKRLASVALSLVVLVLASPVMVTVALAILLDSGSPVLFRQRRVGQNGHLFTLVKFRTMRNGNHGPFRPAQKNDKRFTRLGRRLRRTRLDELPQLWNILRGDMSFVGPRPFACEEERQLARDIPFYTRRWNVKPGATGWAQIQRGYCSTLEDNIEKLAYDLFYVKNFSLGIDLLILFQTTKILLQGRGAR